MAIHICTACSRQNRIAYVERSSRPLSNDLEADPRTSLPELCGPSIPALFARRRLTGFASTAHINRTVISKKKGCQRFILKLLWNSADHEYVESLDRRSIWRMSKFFGPL